jgi:hypothetical protein
MAFDHTEHVLDEIARLVKLQQECSERLKAIVATAREKGCTWEEIGVAAGYTKPKKEAHQRWSEKGRARSQEFQQRAHTARRQANGQLF